MRYLSVTVLLALVAITKAAELSATNLTAIGTNATAKIVNGITANAETTEWVVSLRTMSDFHFCGWVLTAGHCADRIRIPGPLSDSHYVTNTYAYIGQHVLHGPIDPSRQARRVVEVYIHPQFDPDELTYDVALLRLDRDVEGVTPVNILHADELEIEGLMLTVTGWGTEDAVIVKRRDKTGKLVIVNDNERGESKKKHSKVQVQNDTDTDSLSEDYGDDNDNDDTKDSKYYGIEYWSSFYYSSELSVRTLKSATVPFVPYKACTRSGSYQKSDISKQTMICAGYIEGGTDSCQGDSGGPLYLDGGAGNQFLVGTVSWGYGCASPKYYGVYGRVSAFASWIQSYVSEGLKTGDVPAALLVVSPTPKPTSPPKYSSKVIAKSKHVRLMGSNPGYLFVKTKGSSSFRSALADTRFSDTEARVACRELGFSDGLYRWDLHNDFEKLPSKISTFSAPFRCKGNESSLLDCPLGTLPSDYYWTVYYDEQYPAIIECVATQVPTRAPVALEIPISSTSADILAQSETTRLRIVSEIYPELALLEVAKDGEWGIVCPTNWRGDIGTKAKNVACRDLGYLGGSYFSFVPSDSTVTSSVNVAYGDIICDGSEPNLLACEIRVSTECDPLTDAVYVECYNETDSPTPAPTSMLTIQDKRKVYASSKKTRLMYGNPGVLEYRENKWGSVCETNFTLVDRDVACHSFGLGDSARMDLARIPVGSQSLSSALSIRTSDFECNGSETSLTKCTHTTEPCEEAYTVLECLESERPAAVTKLVLSEPTTDSKDTTLSSGILTISLDGGESFGLVCDDFFSLKEANVACRSMGFDGASDYETTVASGEYSIIMDDLDCVGTETDLGACVYTSDHDCSYYEAVYLTCAFVSADR
eukprot:CAMPEP_0171499288 /NCGR_PEP_ID=MMETSP0958-20121227/8348_1 /TAXON_ID=87120 /ORGANISM="Aurantiochytrium limacinum, Strain ATCCMYA-1381" /LENGTH=875 /DNA_ID=CAMNT_0012033833 /DNA_START=33 /DNA_END=2660 /DNA_ORIENTATION=+